MIQNRVKRRINQLTAGCFLIFAAILIKLAWLQLIQRDWLFSKSLDLWQRDFPVSGTRGKLLDANGQILAVDIPSTSVMVVPAQINDKEAAAALISEILEADYDSILKKISQNVSTVRITPEGRLISNDKAKAIEKANLAGVYLVLDSLRYYPNTTMLSTVLGFTGIDNQGLAGLELQYEELLQAKSGSMKIPFDAKGHPVEIYAESYQASGNGLDIMLTIDMEIQSVLERELDNAMKEYNPTSAWALAMNPNTGEILAMVSKPDFDPNHYQDYDPAIYNQNLPVWKSYEPGSVFKTITFATGLEAGLFDMEKDTYNDIGYEMVEGARLKSWKAGGHGLQTYMECLQNSSNPCFVHIAQMLGEESMEKMLDDFGFGKKTGVDLPGESTGILFDLDNWGPLEQATTGFGQGISVTSLQLVSAFCATINGGIYYQPTITKAILDPITHDPLIEVKPKALKRVLSEETSFKMRYALESVVALGGAKQTYIEGYKLGGKTGTAQKAVDGRYLVGEYILSCICVAPADDPQIVVYVALDAPKNNIQYGGTVVSPIIRKCMEDILVYMDIEKTDDQMKRIKLWGDPEKYTIGDYVGMKVKDVKDSDLKFVYIGNGDTVLDQLPSAGTVLTETNTVWLYLGEAAE